MIGKTKRFNHKGHEGEIAKIAGLPPQQAKVGLAGDPGIAKIGN
jgi:hypothetical protein